jgi:hypothetical protein
MLIGWGNWSIKGESLTGFDVRFPDLTLFQVCQGFMRGSLAEGPYRDNFSCARMIPILFGEGSAQLCRRPNRGGLAYLHELRVAHLNIEPGRLVVFYPHDFHLPLSQSR